MADGNFSRMYEVFFHGPVIVYYKADAKKLSSPFENESGMTSFAFEIQHGWKPMFLSTAYCFLRLVCQSNVPILISSTIDIVINGTNIQIFAPEDCVVKQKNGCRLREKSTASYIIPLTNVLQVYGADVRKFGDKMEAWISDGMCVYCEGKQKVVCLEGSEAVLVKGKKKKVL